ncbi:CxxC-x17-CxxC domain-containing protein [Dehalogenimonas etheniformans]|uniref:Zinc-binding protein n=1 Tax=Dehalogenimonas etheniformans TaxID=1536648 RepID=A0A2P5P4Y3_9CHLR|nr:CxxC-x17-CxxC domain-containing protein [Dehalogenimonas etheniformans]PPD57358.1 zinc-binding protein [Dehalogenimonas etheniformans]QNT75207.1 zinc-ribbon domain containing protein [Dehalogenimonas etheniformans]
MSFQTKSIPCCDCGVNFEFSATEQEFYQSKGFVNDPKRCPTCRTARKTERGGNTGNSTSYNNIYVPRQMYPAVCSDCGKSTQVPFEPRNGKPVYCSDCYRKVSANR